MQDFLCSPVEPLIALAGLPSQWYLSSDLTRSKLRAVKIPISQSINIYCCFISSIFFICLIITMLPSHGLVCMYLSTQSIAYKCDSMFARDSFRLWDCTGKCTHVHSHKTSRYFFYISKFNVDLKIEDCHIPLYCHSDAPLFLNIYL